MVQRMVGMGYRNCCGLRHFNAHSVSYLRDLDLCCAHIFGVIVLYLRTHARISGQWAFRLLILMFSPEVMRYQQSCPPRCSRKRCFGRRCFVIKAKIKRRLQRVGLAWVNADTTITVLERPDRVYFQNSSCVGSMDRLHGHRRVGSVSAFPLQSLTQNRYTSTASLQPTQMFTAVFSNGTTHRWTENTRSIARIACSLAKSWITCHSQCTYGTHTKAPTYISIGILIVSSYSKN
ncbi:hypothetical protein F4808DRAFT_407779 [Astrocystis sublimbata]|nr:hypothetical protein F4808DRAFT_407779 [Astrocystis sublimbata]